MTPSLQYHRPKTKEELFELLEKSQPEERVVILAGGTDLMPALKRLPLTDEPTRLISLKNVAELRSISTDGGEITIGSGITLSKLEKDPLVKELLPCLSSTSSLVASPQIRTLATIGGNLLVDNRCVNFNQNLHCKPHEQFCFKAQGDSCILLSNTHTDRFPLCRARFVSDLAPVLTLLNARLCIQSPQGEREISLRTFYSEDGVEKNPLFQGEILVSIKVPIPRTSQVAYRKLRIRNTIDFPSLGVALSILDDTDKKLFMVEAAITGIDVLPRTFHVFLSEYPSEESMLENLCSQARKGTTALRQDFFSPAYRKKMIGVFICSLYYKLRTGFGEAQSNQTKGKGNVDHE